MTDLVASAGVFTSLHIAATAGITGAAALIAGFVIALLSASAVFLWRKSANMPQLNDDGLPPFSANDWLAPVITYVFLGMYASVRHAANDRRIAVVRTLAVVAAFIVNVVTI
jgi:hypothetical protein